MKQSRSLVWAFACLALSVAAVPLEPTSDHLSSLFAGKEEHLVKRRPALPGLPGGDEWYAAPAGFEDAAPGAILNFRPAPRPLSTNNTAGVNVQAMFQIQYRSQNSAGVPIANVLTAIIPHNQRFDALSTHIYFSDVPAPDCNPSLAMTWENKPADWVKQQLGPIIAALDEGWVVAVPDDGGPQASFPSGPNMGYNTLDAMRAMLQSQSITGLQSDATITLNGYSGGGVSATWTAELHPSYAPELNISGIALGGLVPDITYLSNLIKSGQGMFRWGPVAYVGLAHDFPEMVTWLDAELKPERADEFWNVEHLCVQASSDFYGQVNTCDYFTRGCEALDDEVPSGLLLNNTIAGQRDTPTVPLYLYETVGDEVSPVELTRNLYNKWCGEGANIEYEETQIPIPHAVLSVVGFPGALKWMMNRHAREPIVTGCSILPLSPESIASIWPFSIITPYYQTLLADFNLPVGQYWFSK